MKTVTLQPITRHGKNRIAEAGKPARWYVLREANSIGFNPRPGPWLYVSPTQEDSKHGRWVNKCDVDFIVEIFDET